MKKIPRISLRKALILLTISSSLAIAGALFFTQRAQEVTIYCDNSYPPFSYRKDHKLQGIYPEILSTIFSRMHGYKINIKAIPWKYGVEKMKNGEGFALFPPYARPKRRPYMDYTVPIINETNNILTTPARALTTRAVWPDDYVGATVGMNKYFAIPQLEKAKKIGVIIEEYPSTKDNIIHLLNGDIEYYINNKLSVQWELKKLRQETKDDIFSSGNIVSTVDISSEKGYLGFTNQDNGKFTFKKDFITQYHAILKEMKESGEIEKIVNKYK